jgi:hypothetical protein
VRIVIASRLAAPWAANPSRCPEPFERPLQQFCEEMFPIHSEPEAGGGDAELSGSNIHVLTPRVGDDPPH